jgi:hypothetical protein
LNIEEEEEEENRSSLGPRGRDNASPSSLASSRNNDLSGRSLSPSLSLLLHRLENKADDGCPPTTMIRRIEQNKSESEHRSKKIGRDRLCDAMSDLCAIELDRGLPLCSNSAGDLRSTRIHLELYSPNNYGNVAIKLAVVGFKRAELTAINACPANLLKQAQAID